MTRFAANLDWLYTEHGDFLDRFAAAAAEGFLAVECLNPYAHGQAAIAERLAELNLKLVLINAPAGAAAEGERGLACLPGREADFRASLQQALDWALALACPRVHVLSGIVPEGITRAELKPLWLSNLRWAAARAAERGLRLCVEPINTRDMPGYFLNRQDQALDLIAAVGAPNLGLQMDWYHCQIVEGDVSSKLRRAMALGLLEHVQIAGVPDRHEPDEGELRVEYLLGLLDELGYAGFVGCEYRPRAGTSNGLAWMNRPEGRAR